MKVLYGVVGVGMGHAIRSQTVVERLVQEGHKILILASGNAFSFLKGFFSKHDYVVVEKIEGFKFSMKDNAVHTGKTALSVLWRAPYSIYYNTKVYFDHINAWSPDIIISDFESLTGLYAITHNKPLFVIDNIHVLDRCSHEPYIWKGNWLAKILTQIIVKFKVVNADHYFITSAFFPPVRLPNTTLIGPILRPIILNSMRNRGDSFLVYLHGGGSKAIHKVIRSYPANFICYGGDKNGLVGNIKYKKFSESEFIKDLCECKGLISSAGSSLMSEAIYLKVPMLALPVHNQYEQILNARYLQKNELGMCVNHLSYESISAFESDLDLFETNLKKYSFIYDDPLAIVFDYISKIGKNNK